MNQETVIKLVESRNRRSVEQMEDDAARIISNIASKQEQKRNLDTDIADLRKQLLALEAEQHSIADILGEAK